MGANVADADRETLAAAAGDQRAMLQMRLREVEHRLSNTLQLVVSLLQLQARNAKAEASAALLAAADRVSAINVLYEDLLADSGATVDLPRRLEAFLDLQRRIVPDNIRLSFASDTDCRVPRDMAVSLMIVINELITNALQHGFPDGLDGTIALRFGKAGDKYLITIADSGVGTFWPPRSFGFGLRMVNGLVESLGGGVASLPVEAGTRLEVRFAVPGPGTAS